jgi:MYXO-CTERM domain-containing protein
MRRPGWLLLAMTLAALLQATPARACDCMSPVPAVESFAAAAAVFEARLLWKAPVDPNAPYTDYGAVVLRSWKGIGTRDAALVRDVNWCNAPVEVGETYLLYAAGTDQGAPAISRCSRIVKAREAAADVADIGPPVEVRDPSLPLPTPPPAPALPQTGAASPRGSCVPSCSVGAPTTSWLPLAGLAAAAAAVSRRRRSRQPGRLRRWRAVCIRLPWCSGRDRVS